MSEEKQSLTPIEAINDFYRLKDKYESSYYEKYVKPIVTSGNTKKEKRVFFSKLQKAECINCKRNVGTTFTIKCDKNESMRQFMAKCGDLTDPCPLDIHIDYSIRTRFDTAIEHSSKKIDMLKMKIIKEKNNAIFFNKDVISSFEKITTDLKQTTKNVEPTKTWKP